MIEEFIGGREIQVAIMGKKKLGAIELRPKRKFYDYKAKYEKKAGTDHIIPVNLTKSKMNNMLKKLELVKVSQLRTGGLIFAIIGFIIIYYTKN